MAPSLRLRHVPRYGELLRLLVAHRHAFLGHDGTLGGEADAEDEEQLATDAAALVQTLQDMGPTYVKLGQLLASRVDLLPAPYTDALGRLQDRAEPMPAEDVRRVVEEELGTRVHAAFTAVEPKPLGSASLAQVHRATLHDGRTVALKVQRPDIRGRILDDMDVIAELATAFDEHVGAAGRAGLAQVVDQFRTALLGELDYRQEAANLRALQELLQPYDRLRTAVPVERWSAARVLTMTLVPGAPLSNLRAPPPAGVEAAVDQLFKAYLDQVLVHGMFHADPHAGNVLVSPDGHLGLIDAGMAARIGPDVQDALLRLLVAVGDGRGAEAADALERAGERLQGFDRRRLRRDVSGVLVAGAGGAIGDMEVGRQLATMARVALSSGLRPAPELAMVAKALLGLDEVARRLAPDFEPTASVREHTVVLLRHRLTGAASPSNLVSTALDARDLMQHLPRQVERVLDALAEGPVRISVDGIDEAEIMRSVQKLANRGAGGLGVVALVLAAAIFSLQSGGPRLMGESGFTVVLLGMAFLLGLTLVVATLRSDLPQRRRRRRRP